MPLPLAPLIVAGTELLGQGINAAAQGSMNKKTRKWNEKMYGMQRQDAITDWQMQNAYNSPASQMQRLREAGLNPNLVYGHGADAQGGIIRSTDVKGWNPQAPSFQPGSAMAKYFDTQIQQQQYDLLNVQKTLKEQEIKNKQAEELKTMADTAKSQSSRDLIDTLLQIKGMDLSYMPMMKATTLAGMRANVEKTLQDTKLSQANTQYRIAENERRQLITGMTLEQGAVKILQMRKQMLLASMKGAADYQVKVKQANEIDARIQKIQEDAKGSHERARILQSTPDWGDQRATQMLQDLLGGATKSGTYFNPKIYQGWRR